MLKIDSWGIALVCLSILGFQPFHLGISDVTEHTNAERRLLELETAAMLSYLEFEQIRRDRYATHVTLSAEVAGRLSYEVGRQVPITLRRAAYWRDMWKTAEDHLDPTLLKCIYGMLDADVEKRLGVERGVALPPRDEDCDFIWTGAHTNDAGREARFAQLKQDLQAASRLWPYKAPQRRSVNSTLPASRRRWPVIGRYPTSCRLLLTGDSVRGRLVSLLGRRTHLGDGDLRHDFASAMASGRSLPRGRGRDCSKSG